MNRGPIYSVRGTGMYVDFDIKHDDWCPVLTQPAKIQAKLNEACECNPDIFFALKGQRYQVTELGNVVRVGK
jgi:hypothetical protein